MARFALIKDGVVENVIVADSAWAEDYGARNGFEVREVVTEVEAPTTTRAIVSRSCEPGARLVERDAQPSELARARRRGARNVVEDFAREPRNDDA